MTREEAAANLLQYLKENEKPGSVWATSLDMAISALREQEERSKGCDFCKGAKYIYGELSASGHVDDDHDFVCEQYGDLPICPICGRRLEEV